MVLPDSTGNILTADNLVFLTDSYTSSSSEESFLDFNYTGVIEDADKSDENLQWDFEIVIGIFTVLLVPIILGGNGTVLYVLYRSQYLRTKTNIYIGFLALADSLLGVITLPLYASYYWFSKMLMQHRYLCILKLSSVLTLLTASLLTLLAVAVDRYKAVLRPFKYRSSSSTNTAKKIVITIWIYSFGIGIIPFFVHSYDGGAPRCDFYDILPQELTIPLVPITIFICLLISFAIYVRVFVVMFNRHKASSSPNVRRSRPIRKQENRERRSVFAMAVVLFVFFLFWVPLLITSFMKSTNPDTATIIDIVKDATVLLAQSNSGVNPFIYSFMKTDISRESRAVWRNCFVRKNTSTDCNFQTNESIPNDQRSASKESLALI